MSSAEKSVRQSVTLPARVARRVKSLAKTNSTSANRIIVELIESGIEARQQEKKRFIELADRLARSRDPEEQARLKEELAVMTFGEQCHESGGAVYLPRSATIYLNGFANARSPQKICTSSKHGENRILMPRMGSG